MVSAVAVLCIALIAPPSTPGGGTSGTTNPEVAAYAVGGDPAPAGITAILSVAVAAAQADEDEDEDEDPPTAAPTLEREAPPRPNATMARSHKAHDRPLVLGDHQLVSPTSPFTPDMSETGAPPQAVVPRDGLVVQGVGVLLARTPEDVALTRNGVEIANLEWLLDPAMHLGGRHPRVAFEGDTFTVTVTAEARNVSIMEGDRAYVVLLPPPTATGVYEITRISEPRSLRDGERGVWEFSVVTRTGRLMLADLSLSEERLVTNLTSTPDLFAFRAYAFTDGQEVLSTALSDPVIATKPPEAGGVTAAEELPLPAIYACAGIQSSTLHPDETMMGAWERGIDHDTIVAEAAEHVDLLKNLKADEIITLYAEEEKSGPEASSGSSSGPSPLDLITGFFQGLFGWLGGLVQ